VSRVLVPSVDASASAVAPPNTIAVAQERVRAYAWYALAVLTLASVFNFADRQIVSILAQSMKGDLGLTDAQLGFLLGTAFAVFYAVVGIAMGRIADGMNRTSLMAAGMAVWSATTALGAAATNFAGLGTARVGVGVGEAVANPCANSLLCDYFPARLRGTALGIYLTSAYLGMAVALLVGGLTLQHWSSMCTAVPIAGACGVHAWKAALLIVGLPGLPVAALVYSLREPNLENRPHTSRVRLILRELGAALPPFTFFNLYRAGGSRLLLANLGLVAAVAVCAALLVRLTGDLAQWAALGLGVYSTVTWGQVQKQTDAPFYRLTFGCPTYTVAMLSGALLGCMYAAISAWAAPYAMRELGMPPASAGVALGLTYAAGAGVGVISGGWLTDRWKLKDARAPIWTALIGLVVAVPVFVVMLSTRQASVYVAAYGVFGLFASAWSAAYAALVQDLVLSRMRGGAASAFALVCVIVGAGAGPYWVGKISAITGSLATGLLSILLLVPVIVVVLLLTARRLRHETENGRRARAEAYGEPKISDSYVTRESQR
jgi:MFS family permease